MAENPGFGVRTLRQTCDRCGAHGQGTLWYDKTQEEWVCQWCRLQQLREVDSP